MGLVGGSFCAKLFYQLVIWRTVTFVVHEVYDQNRNQNTQCHKHSSTNSKNNNYSNNKCNIRKNKYLENRVNKRLKCYSQQINMTKTNCRSVSSVPVTIAQTHTNGKFKPTRMCYKILVTCFLSLFNAHPHIGEHKDSRWGLQFCISLCLCTCLHVPKFMQRQCIRTCRHVSVYLLLAVELESVWAVVCGGQSYDAVDNSRDRIKQNYS